MVMQNMKNMNWSYLEGFYTIHGINKEKLL